MRYLAILLRNGENFDAELAYSFQDAQEQIDYWKQYIGEEDWDVDNYEAVIFQEVQE